MNRFLTEPDLVELQTEIADVLSAPDGGFLVAARDNVLRPEGGGQPADRGTIEINGTEFRIAGLSKGHGGLVYAELPDLTVPPPVNTPIVQYLDVERRGKLRKLHSLQHLYSAAAARIAPDAQPCGTDLLDDASGGWIRLRFGQAPKSEALCAIHEMVRGSVTLAAPIVVTRANSVEEARVRYRSIFRIDPAVRLTGKVRVVVIQQVDANCCGALHWHSSAIGEFQSDAVTIQTNDLGELIELRFELVKT